MGIVRKSSLLVSLEELNSGNKEYASAAHWCTDRPPAKDITARWALFHKGSIASLWSSVTAQRISLSASRARLF